MSWLAGPFAVACALLLLAGGQKALRPDHTGVALRAAGLPGSRAAVRALASLELTAAALGLAGWRPAAGAVAALYAGFAFFVIRALAADTPLRSCGCFAATDDIPPTGLHVVIDAVLAVVVAGVVLHHVDVVDVVRAQPAAAVPFLAMAAATTYLAYVALAVRPLVTAADDAGRG